MGSSGGMCLEELEPRVLLSGDGLSAAHLDPAGAGARGAEESAILVQHPVEEVRHNQTSQGNPDLISPFDPAAQVDGIFASAQDLFANSQPLHAESAGGSDPIVVGPGEVLKGSGDFPPVENHGTVSPGNSPGVQNVPSFTQDDDGKLVIEIAGTGGPGAANGHDKVNVSGAATLDGTLEIDLLNGFVPSAGQSFEVMDWGSRSGTFSKWLGTAGIPGHPELAFVPVYNANNLTLQVVNTPSITGAEVPLNSGLTQLSNLAGLLNGLDEFAQAIPFIGGSLGSIVDMGSAVNNAIRAQLSSLISSLPSQSAVTSAIQNWDGTTAGGFTIHVLGVLGHYGTVGVNPFWWDLQLELEPAAVNKVLSDVSGAVLGAVFNPKPTVQVQGSLALDLSFGYDSSSGGFFTDINAVTAKAEVNANGMSGFAFNLAPPGGPVSLNVTSGSVHLTAQVTATPDASVQDANGRIELSTLSNIVSGTIPAGDAFNLEKSSSLDASFTLSGQLTGFGFNYSGLHTVKVHSDDLFSGDEPDLTIQVDGSLEILNQMLQGTFVLKKTATETVLEASNVSLTLMAGAGGLSKQILHADNGSGTFKLIGDDLAGTASLTITSGPTLPNISISGTTINLAFNSSSEAVPSIDGVAVNLPAGPYYRVSGHAVIGVTVPAVSMDADFVFEPFDPTPGLPGSGDEVVNAGVANLTLNLGVGSTNLLHVDGANGAFVFTKDGYFGVANNANATLTVPGVTLSGTFSVQINNIASVENTSVNVNGTTVAIDLPAGPFVRVVASDATLDILGISVRGTFAFEEKTSSPGSQDVVTVAASNVSLDLGATANDLVNITGGSGTFIFTDAGVAGFATVTLSAGVPHATTPTVGFSGTFELRINTVTDPVNRTVTMAGTPVVVNLPGGPYLRLFGHDVTLNLFGLSIVGDYTFEQKETSAGRRVVTIEAENVRFNFGTSLVQLTNGEALFVLTDGGMAGRGSIDVQVNALGGSFSQPFTWEFNNTGQPFDEIIPNDAPSMGAASLSALGISDVLENFDLPEGPYNRLSSHGPVGFSFTAAGHTQSASAEIVLTLETASSGDYVTVGVSQFNMNFGAGPLSILVSDGTGALLINSAGVAGKVTAGSVSLGGAPAGVTLSAEDLAVEFNSTGANVDTAVVVSENPDVEVPLHFVGTYYHNFLAVAGTADLAVGSFVTLGGDFMFEVSNADPNMFKIAADHLHFDLKAGSLTILSFFNGTGAFVLGSGGVAGTGTLQFQSGLIGVAGTITFELNSTSSAVNTTISTPSGNKNINLTGVNYFKITVNGSLLIGSASLPFNFTVQNAGGTVEFRETGTNTLLVSISPTGAITTGLSFGDFAAPGPIELVSLLVQLGNWIGAFRESDIFQTEIPFTHGVTLGDAFDWSKVFLNQIYSKFISVELQSGTLREPGTFGGVLLNAKFKLQFDSDAPVEVVVANGASQNYANLDQLAALFNTAFAAAGISGRVEARKNKDDQFVIALKDDKIAKGTTLKMVDLDAQIETLGFGPKDGVYGDSDDVTAEQTSIQAPRYDRDDFFAALGTLFGSTVTYNAAQRVYTYDANLSDTVTLANLPLDFGFNLGPIASASLTGALQLSGSVDFHFTLGFDLGAREVPRLISSALVPVPATGRISSDAHFTVALNNGVPISLVLPAASTATNNSVDDLAADLNVLFGTVTYNGTPLNHVIIAQRAGTGLAISALDEDVNHNGVLDSGEDLNGDTVLESQLGVINKIEVDAPLNDSFITELGFGDEPYDASGTTMVRASATSDIKGLFLENPGFHASLNLTTTTPIAGTLRFGFVEISTSGGEVATKNADGTPNPLQVSLSLQNPASADGRFYLTDLFHGLSSENIGSFVDGPHLTGSFLARLDNITVGGLGFSLPLGSNPEISLFIPDITDLHFNSDPYDGTSTGVFLTYPDLGSLDNFESLSFTQIVQALKAVADSLSQLSAFSFLDEPLPFVNLSINDMLDYAGRFADLIDAASQNSSTTLQQTLTQLKTQIDHLFHLDPSILSVSVDTNGISSSPFLGGGVNNSAQAVFDFNPTGGNNGIRFSSKTLATAASLNGARIRVVGSSSVNDASARATWDAERRELKVEINPGVTTAGAIVTAVNGASGSPIGAALIASDGGTNSGTGTIVTTALRFTFNFSTGYANSLPFQLDLNDLVSRIAGDNVAASQFLQAATTLIQVQGSGNLTVSASAALTLDFGLDLSSPGTIKPFFYDTTGVELTAKVLGTNLNIEASLGSVVGIFVKDGEITLDQDGDPASGAAQGDKGARFHLGLQDNNGDGRHYFSENWFDSGSIDLSLEGGVSARLPIFAPVESLPLGGTGDTNHDNVPDNQLFINIPDLVRLFIDDTATGGVALMKFGGDNNDVTINSSSHTGYAVDLVNDPDASPSATFDAGANRLTIHFKSGVTTGAQLVTAIQSVATFGATALTATDNGSANNGSGTVAKMTIVTPNISALFDSLDLCALLDSQAGNLLNGLDAFLGKIQDGLNAIVFSTKLPVIGDGLAGAANFIENFRTGMLQELRNALDASSGSATTAIENAIKQALWKSLGPEGLDLLVDPATGNALDPSLGYGQLNVTLDCDTGLIVKLRLKKDIALLDTSAHPIDFDIGVPGFGLQVGGNVKVKIGFDLKFGFGISKEDGFYFDSSAPASAPELTIGFEVTIPGLSASGQLFFLQLDASDNADDPSYFTGRFVVDLKDPNHDGKLTFAELTGSGTQFSDIIAANLEAVAHVNLSLAASFGGNASFPRVLAEFHLDWRWDLVHGSSDPEIAFTNIYLDLGSFLSDFLGPILKEIRKVTEPLDPIIEIATTPIPVLSDLAGEPITLLDLAEIFGVLEPSTVDFIQSVIQVVDLINSLEGLGEGEILIPFGSFNLSTDSSGQMTHITPLQNLGNIDLGQAISDATGPGVSETYKSSSAGFAGKLDSLDNFSIPIFDHPTELFNLFVGEPVRLIEWRMPQFKFEFTYTQRIPIYPPLYAQFGGDIGATINIGFGYDTFGIQKFINDPDKNGIDLLDGFYVIDFDQNGNERPELSLKGEIFAGASINLLIAEAGVRGGITATIDFDLNDINDDGKVRVSEIIANAQQDPRCIFDIHGRLGLFLEAFLNIDLFFFSIDKTWRFADITLFEFDITCPTPVLAELNQATGTLTLNMGSRASDRKEIDTTDNSETFKVVHISGDASGEKVEVQWGNWKQQYDGVKKVVVEDAGQGDDNLDFRGVLSPVEAHGGPGNDTIFLGDGNASKAWGGDGRDTITAGGGTGAVIYGDDGNDAITAGSVAIEIHGGDGNDVIGGSPEGDTIFGDGGADQITGLAGNDVIDGGDGNDTIDAAGGIDTILGGKGADILTGGTESDIIDGGDGDDQILGGAGNDFLAGGNGDDKIFGHGGIDLLIGDEYGTVNGGAVTAANVVSLLAAIETAGVAVQGISGSGNDFLAGGGNYDVIFGGDGADFLYGGNYLEQGSTETIEEDNNDFFDGGAGDDQIFGDDAMGRTGDRNTGIAIKSSVWHDLNNNGLRDENEKGLGGVTVELHKQSDDSLLATYVTKADGTFEFLGLDPNNYYLKFTAPSGSGLVFTDKWKGHATSPTEAKNDSDVRVAQGRTDQFFLDFSTTLDSVAAGFKGPANVSIDSISVNEGDSGTAQGNFVVRLSGPQLLPVEVQYRIDDGSATVSSGDYLANAGLLTFKPGETEKTITVTINGDTSYEDNEQVHLTILRAQRMDPVPFNLLVTSPSVTGTIINDDPIPQISIADSEPVKTDADHNPATAPTAPEGRTAEFVVSLSNPSQSVITVQYRADTALDFQAHELQDAARPFPLYPATQADFDLTSGTLTFQPGETRKVIKVNVRDDATDENDEHFWVDLFGSTQAQIADSRGYGIIADDDAPVSVTIVPVTPVGGPFRTEVAEGNSGLTPVSFQVKLSQQSGKTVTVTWATSPGTAVESVPHDSMDPVDYIGAPNSTTPESLTTLTFAPGETVKTVTVMVQGDTKPEGDEEFFVNILSAGSADIARGAPAENNHITIVIKDDDSGSPTDAGPWSIYFDQPTYTIQEPSTGVAYLEVTFRRTPGSSNPVAVLYTQDGSANAGADYIPVFRQIVYFEGAQTSKKVQIAVRADSLTEGIETFHLYLNNPTGGPVKAAPSHSVVRILDGDAPAIKIYPPLLSVFPVVQYGIIEGSSGGLGTHDFTVLLNKVAGPGGVTVSWETVDLTARSPQDFTAASGVLVIPAGSSIGTISVQVREDTTAELSETFAVRLKNPINGTLAKDDSTAIATIYDDDLTPVTGRVFYDSNGNGFRDDGEAGIPGVSVKVSWMQNGTEHSTVVPTNSAGIYSANVALGQISAVVDGSTVASPYGPIFLLFTGTYESTTANEDQSVVFDGAIGISPFQDVGYKNTITFAFPKDSKTVGRGGTDDTIYGGPGDDLIDAGAGDDYVIGGHWMTATDSNAPVNLGNYDAKVKANTSGLHSVHDGTIFSIDTTGISAGGSISGEIWQDNNLNNQQDGADPLFTSDEIIVNLYDGAGNEVNSVVTTNGKYQFTGLYLKPGGQQSKYVVEFQLPDGWTFVSPHIGAAATDSDAINGGRTSVVILTSGSPSTANIDAGIKPADTMPSSGSGGFEFDDPSYTVSENDGYVDVTVVRGNSFEGRSVVVRTFDKIGPGFAHAGVNYQKISTILYFDVGETVKVVRIPIIDTNSIGFTDTLSFFLELRAPTGRPLNNGTVYIYGDGAGTITDDDTIDGGKDWDIIIGDSGNIPPEVDVEHSASWDSIVSAGGPGKDVINAGDGTDFVDGQLGNDTLAGNEGLDEVRGGLGDDLIYAELDIDNINGDHGMDTVVSFRDVPLIELKETGPATADLLHKKADGDILSTFHLSNIEMARLLGGPGDNRFNIEGWNGSAMVSGAGGNDTLEVKKDSDMILKNASVLQGLLFDLLYGFFKDASISMSNDITYHLGGLEKIVLTGGPSANSLDASGFSRAVTLIGLGGDDVLTGGSGNDTFAFDTATALGTDTITGNGGIDTLDFSQSAAGVTVNLAVLSPSTQNINGNLKLKLQDKIEAATGGSGNDSLTGNDLDNILVGGPGSDTLTGGAGNETYVFDTDNPFDSETVVESIADPGTDTLDFSGTLTRAISVNLALLNQPQVVNDHLTLTITGEGLETVIGGALSDTIRGNSNNNVLRGGTGNDLLDGNSGDDLLDGGAGNDDLDGGAGNDRIQESANTNFTLTDSKLARANGEIDSLRSIERADLTGGAGPNRFTLTGWSGTGSVSGGGNFDTVVMAEDVDFTVSNTSLIVGTRTIGLNSIEAVNLSGGPSGNFIDASAFSGTTIIDGGDGDDVITGGSGPDTIRGGLGDDSITGGPGTDNLDGGLGTDTIDETRDAAQFVLKPNRLVIDLTPALNDEESDTLTSVEKVILRGGGGANTFDLSAWSSGNVIIHGGGGTDVIRSQVDGSVVLTDTELDLNGVSGWLTFNGIEGAWLTGGDHDDQLDVSAFSGSALLEGGKGSDRLIAGHGITSLDGGDGDDVLVFAQDGVANTIFVAGGDGRDTLDFSAFTSGISVNLGTIGSTQTVLAGDLQLYLRSEDIEVLIGGSGADTLTGNSLDNEITGGGGVDNIAGGGGTDRVVETADANFILTNGSLTIGGTTDFLVSIEAATLTGGPSANTINAAPFGGSTILIGGDGNDTILGGNGPDVIEGGAGDDVLRGGIGTDLYRFDADTPLGSDTIDELSGAAGIDALDFSGTQSSGVAVDLSVTTPQAVNANLKITLTHGDSIEWVQGTDQDDVLRGNALDNLFVSRIGLDTVDGGGGNDTIGESRDADFVLTDTNLFIGAEKKLLVSIEKAILGGGDGNNTIDARNFTGSVTLSGGAGDDILIGGKQSDTLNGGEGSDQLFGNAGNDTLSGGSGDDELNGGGVEHGSGETDNDVLNGNTGNDTYVFDNSRETGTDQVNELAGEGYMDVLKGAGLAGVQIDIHAPGAHGINPAQPAWISNIVLLNPTEIEDAY